MNEVSHVREWIVASEIQLCVGTQRHEVDGMEADRGEGQGCR